MMGDEIFRRGGEYRRPNAEAMNMGPYMTGR